jgi:hypothetical protein
MPEINFNFKDGSPVIEIIHHDRTPTLEENLLGYFIKEAKAKGLEIKGTTGYLKSGTNESWSKYEIRIKKEND